MDIVKKHLTNGQYLTQVYEKFSQFLHHTVGIDAMGAWRWWNSTPDRVGTPYIIDRDGVIVECFDPSMWAYHLGVKGDDNWHEKHSINYELVSAGALQYVDKEFRFYPLWPNKLRYVTIPEEEVYTFDKPWKGFRHWHKYTDDQIDALIWIMGKNTLDFPTLKVDNDINEIFEFKPEVLTDHTSGIWTHNTVREDKSDPFPYPPLIKALKGLQKELGGFKEAKSVGTVDVKPTKTKTVTKKSSK